jgi:hypothetical protein
MKLISELTEQVEYIVEEVELAEGKKEKSYKIKGPFMQAEVKNRNGRMYPKETMIREVNRYNDEYVKKNRAFGELGHPEGPTINLDRVSHMITDISENGNDFIGTAKILATPYGNIVRNLISEGAQLGVSSRGMGTLKAGNDGVQVVQDDFHLATAADIVADPSAPNAFVQGIMEGREYWYDAGSNTWRVEQMAESMKQMSAKELEERKLEAFTEYMRLLLK